MVNKSEESVKCAQCGIEVPKSTTKGAVSGHPLCSDCFPGCGGRRYDSPEEQAKPAPWTRTAKHPEPTEILG